MKKDNKTGEKVREKSETLVLKVKMSELDVETQKIFMEFNPRESAFLVLYTLLGSKTCSNAKGSAVAAGYSETSARTTGWNLTHRPDIRAAIGKIHKAQMSTVTPERILHDLEDEHSRALEKGDLAAAIKATELQGRYLTMFSDRLYIVPDEMQEQLDDVERAEAQAIASIRLNQMAAEGRKVIESVEVGQV